MWILHHGLLAVLVFGGWYLAGRLPARKLRVEHSLAPWVLGLGIQTVLLYGLAALGLLPSGKLMAAVLVVPALPGLVDLRLRRPSHGALLAGGLFGTLFGVLLLPFALLALTPTISWDADVYHLALPRLFLEQGGFRPVEMNVYSNWPLGTELLYTQTLALGGAVLAKVTHLGFGLLVLGGLWVGARAIAGAKEGRGVGLWAGGVAGAFWLLHPVVLFEHRVAYVELAHAFWMLATFLLLEAARRDREHGLALVAVAGVAAGLLASVKLTGGVHAVLLGGLLLPGVLRVHGRRALAAYLVPLGVLGALWPLKSWVMTGNPVYPFAHGLFGGPDWSPALAEQLGAWQSSIGRGRAPLDWLLLPVRIFWSGGQGYENFDGELAAASLVLVPAGLWGVRRLGAEARGVALRASAAAGLLFVLWAFTSQQMRLLVPVLALLALPVGLGLARLASLSPRPRAVSLVVVGLLVGVLLFENGGVARAGLRSFGPLVAGTAEQIRASGVPAPWRTLRDVLRAEDRVLLLQMNRRYFAPSEVLADSFFEASQIAAWLAEATSPRQVLERLRERRVTHVLLERRPSPIQWPAALQELLQSPAELPLVWTSPDERFLLWAVPADPGAGVVER